MDLQNQSLSLREYVRIVYEIESSIFQQQRFIKELSESREVLPPEPPPAVPKPEFHLRIITPHTLKICGTLCLASLVQIILGAIFPDSLSFLWSLGVAILVSIILFFVVYGSALNYRKIIGKETLKKEIAQWEADNEDRKKYNIAHRKLSYINLEIVNAINKLQESKKCLADIYNANIIYPKYRNLPAVSCFLDYLLSGRCATLEGTYGAYNLYENEARMNRIITRLDHISVQLNQIQFNQQLLYGAIEQCNQNVNRLVTAVNQTAELVGRTAASTGAIEQSQATIAYQAKLLQKELAYRNRMQYGVNYR